MKGSSVLCDDACTYALQDRPVKEPPPIRRPYRCRPYRSRPYRCRPTTQLPVASMTTTVPTDGLPTDIAIPSDTERQGYDTISTVTSDIHSPRDTAYQKTIRGSHEVPYMHNEYSYIHLKNNSLILRASLPFGSSSSLSTVNLVVVALGLCFWSLFVFLFACFFA